MARPMLGHQLAVSLVSSTILGLKKTDMLAKCLISVANGTLGGNLFTMGTELKIRFRILKMLKNFF